MDRNVSIELQFRHQPNVRNALSLFIFSFESQLEDKKVKGSLDIPVTRFNSQMTFPRVVMTNLDQSIKYQVSIYLG